MDFELGMELIKTAYQQRTDERLYYRWCIMHQSRISFDAFKAELGFDENASKEAHVQKDVSEIMANVERIVEAVHNGNI